MLRPYQQKLKHETREAIRAGYHRPLIVAPTGSGKGAFATDIVHEATAKNKRVVFLVNRKSLVMDMSRRLFRLGVNHGILMGEHTQGAHLPTIVASIDTLRNRLDTIKQFDLAFADEAHLAVSEGWMRTFEAFGPIPIIGMTATPIRLDGKGLGRVFNQLILGPTITELVEEGHLVSGRILSCREIGNSEDDEDTPGIIGNIVSTWREHAHDWPTIAFAKNVAHSEHIRDQFVESGIAAEHIDDTMP